jgi:predicted  nucleic acid-binding Zn-ribbon protein
MRALNPPKPGTPLGDFLAKLRIPFNPLYDHEQPPESQAELANPVELKNRSLIFSNATMELAAAVVEIRRELLGLRKELRAAKKAVTGIEMEALRSGPMPSADKNSTRLQQAFIEKRIAEGTRDKEYWAHRGKVDSIEESIEELKDELENCETWTWTLKQAAENVQTHLSFTKHEMDNAKRGGFGR